ncbi:FadR/GntR family transcriptional regulator [Rathayibacter soli]|uniref:FadR/GntR family transcriptional regulator n=1 Tax=Rathayibacter soli TaxID=3144168 RepID=UPI0027E5924B|nr:GntR family transcriptional regulator [Glaciibacter superstes]
MGTEKAQTPRVGSAAREAIFAQLADAGRSEQVAQRLTDAIILGVLAPSERLPSEPDLARRFGVALITVREGLGILRASGLVETRRGREGGSFVTSSSPHGGLIDARLRALSQVDLSDMAVYFATILSGCAERASTRATDAEADRLGEWIASIDMSTAASARANLGGFCLEIAVLSQSSRLMREQIRVQAEFGPLLLLALDDESVRADAAGHGVAIAAAIRAHDPTRARELVSAQIDALAAGLLAAKFRLAREDAAAEVGSASAAARAAEAAIAANGHHVAV